MKKKNFAAIIVSVFIILIIGSNLSNQLHAEKKESHKKLIKKLTPKYRLWYDMVYYIITPMEKNVFFQLTNNRDRDSFINLFWSLRDPSKGTPQNEYKDEHIKRVKYANRYYKYGTPLPGWKTDRGKIHILLGPPLNKNEINQNGLYPVQIWDYFGGVKKNLPTVFNVVFYRPHNTVTWRLYIPAVDGPAALLRGEIGGIEPNDYRAVYEKIHDLDPNVAQIALSLIPGENTNGFRASLQDPLLMTKIYDLPKRTINANYARNFLNYKGIVETSVTTSYINIKTDVYTLKDPILGLNFIHLAVKPERVSVDFSPEQNKYYFNFNLLVVLRKGEDTVMQYEKKFPFYYTKEELDQQLSHGIIITDYFPVIEGKFQLAVVLQNSINKEISYFEKMIDIPNAAAAQPTIFGPLVTYRIDQLSDIVYSSFNIMGNNIKIDPSRTFGLRDSITTLFCVDRGAYNKPIRVEVTVASQDESRPYSKTYPLEFPSGKRFWCFTIPLEKLRYSNYEVKAKVSDEKGTPLDVKSRYFQVSPKSYVPHPPMAGKRLRKENQFLFHNMVATQYQKMNNQTRAQEFFEKALKIKPKFAPTIKNYASLLMTQKKYDNVLAVIEDLKGQEKEAFSYFSYKGRALYHMNSYNAAVDALLEANKIYDSDVPVLNTLGSALIRIGGKEEALQALSASLKINKYQKDVEKIVQQLKKEIDSDKNKKNKSK